MSSKRTMSYKGLPSSHPASRYQRRTNSATTTSASQAPPPVFLTLSPSSFTSLALTAHNFFHVSVGRINGRLMALPVVLDCHSSLLVASTPADAGTGVGTVSGAVVLGRLFAHLPTLIADVNVAKLKNVKDRPNLLETDHILFTYQFRETHSNYHIMVRHTHSHTNRP